MRLLNQKGQNIVLLTMQPLIIVSFLLAVFTSSCTKDEYGRTYTDVETPAAPVVPTMPPVPVDTPGVKTYLALGDSYTIGQSVSEAERYPNQLAALLKQDSILIAQPEIIARTGWTTFDLLTRLNSNPPLNNSYDIVTLLIGVNNQYQRLSQANYREEFKVLLEKAIAYAGKKRTNVIVLSIPDYGVTPFGMGSNSALISSQVDSFNVINREVTITEGCTYVDITPSSKEALTNPGLVASDGLHPSGSEYRKWALMLEPIFKALVKK